MFHDRPRVTACNAVRAWHPLAVAASHCARSWFASVRSSLSSLPLVLSFYLLCSSHLGHSQRPNRAEPSRAKVRHTSLRLTMSGGGASGCLTAFLRLRHAEPRLRLRLLRAEPRSTIETRRLLPSRCSSPAGSSRNSSVQRARPAPRPRGSPARAEPAASRANGPPPSGPAGGGGGSAADAFVLRRGRAEGAFGGGGFFYGLQRGKESE